MNAPPPRRLEEQQRCEKRGFHRPRHLKIPKSLGLVFSSSVHPGGGRGAETTHPTRREGRTPAPPPEDPHRFIPPYKSAKFLNDPNS